MQITEQIKDIKYMLDDSRYEGARTLLEALIRQGNVQREAKSPTMEVKPHGRGKCWCGIWHQDS